MKSRNFTFINSTDSGLAAQGYLLARPTTAATPDVAAVVAARRFELQHNQSPRFARRRAQRRQGQALLLAVLIMLLAALLSAGFLAVVSGNLNQSARIADKTRAIEASRAGIAYANAQLSGSSQGDLWRPIDVSPAPAPGSANPDYNYYYSQLDRVQGWANNLTPPNTSDTYPKMGYPTSITNYDDALAYYRNTTYGKFPDPTQIADDAPKFLVKVEELPTNLPTTDSEYEHRGELKITSIGLSEDDPNVFHRAVAYKTGRKQLPWASALRSISNWNFKTNQVPSTVIKPTTTIPPSTTPVDVTVDKPVFSADDVPFNVVIGQKQGPVPVQGAVVTKVNGTTLTLDQLPIPLLANTENRIELAAAIGTAQTIDLFNTGTPDPFPTNEQPNGVRANGSLWLQGQAQLSNLSKNGTNLRSSGVVALTALTAGAGPDSLAAVGPASPNSTTDVASAGRLISSSFSDFPGNFTTVSGVKKTDLVDDGWDRTSPTLGSLTYSNARNVEPFKPVDLSSKTNRDRYRNLARNSVLGAYIDNTEDIEKVGARPMTQAELMRMWLSPTPVVATELFTRDKLTNATIPSADSANSLEEQHLRGWIGSDEFLARGALVELIPAVPGPGNLPRIRVTLDSRADNTTTDNRNATGPVGSKVWRDAGGVPQPGVYVKEFAWPTNGVIFAEGNIRIRGSVTGAPNSLTVVSMGNIYIEGSVGVDRTYEPVANVNPDPATVTRNNLKKKLMLLARKNVVVNPTRLTLGHVEVQTKTTTDIQTPFPARQNANLAVQNNLGYKVGDVVETSSFTGTTSPYTLASGIRGVVTDTAVPNQITVYVLVGGTVPVGSTVSTVIRDARAGAGTATDPKVPQVNSTNAFERRVLLPGSDLLPNLRLALDHYGQRKGAFKVKTVAAGTAKPANLAVFMTNKKASPFTAGLTRVEAVDKIVRGEYNSPATGSPDNFPPTPTATYSLANLETAMDNMAHPDLPATEDWKYDTSVSLVGADGLPFYFLTGVGLRYNPDRTLYPAVNPADPTTWRSKDIGGTEEFEIPMATSVNVLRNRTQVSLETEQAATPGVTLPYFGFNPRYMANAPDLGQEDRLTVDQSFFQPEDKTTFSTLDSRKLLGIAPSTQNVLTTDDVLTFQQTPLGPNYTAAQEALLPDYRVKAAKLENTVLPTNQALYVPVPTAPIDLTVNAYVYAQEGRWFVISGDYFRSGAPVRSLPPVNGGGTPITLGTYIDYNNDKKPDVGEYVDANGSNTFDAGDFADLNHNGIRDPGEVDAVQRFLRYNYQLNYYGAIVENKTAPVSGAVSEWMDKMANYTINGTGPSTATQGWKFISYTYDPSLALETTGSQTLRVPVTDDLLYQQ